MYVISHKATFLSTSFTNKPRMVMFVKSFVSLFIPVLRDTKIKHRRLVTSIVCLTSTRSDDGKSSPCYENTSPSTFFQAFLLKVTLPQEKGLESTETSVPVEAFIENLMGRKPEKRFDFIQQNAQFVEDIDI